MSKVENERCIEDDECKDDLICLSGLCKDPKGSFAEVSKFQKEHLEKKRNKDDAELEISGIKAQKEKLQKQLANQITTSATNLLEMNMPPQQVADALAISLEEVLKIKQAFEEK